MSLRETLLTAVMSTLAGASGAGIHVYRSRTVAVSTDADVAVLVRPASDTPEQIVIPYMDRTLEIEVQVRARGEIPDSAADATVADVHAKLMANRTLSGNALDIEEGPTDWAFDDADTPLTEVTMRYRVKYRTADNSLT